MKKVLISAVLLSVLTPILNNGAAFSSESLITAQQPRSNALLIFLDDSEKDIGAITGDFLAAFNQEAAPIIVSSSIIKNTLTFKPEQNLSIFQNKVEELENKPAEEYSPEETVIHKNVILSIVDIDTQIKEKWLVKEINPSLLLLLPKKYLGEKKLELADVEAFLQQASLTETERILGLKVNHMKTRDSATVQKQDYSQEQDFADYFISSLNDIFVLRKEYQDIASAPTWAIYIVGHGLLNYSICHLSPEQFKEFLHFLETIQTKILVYTSCYAAGTNETLIYKDALSGADQTYGFTVIAQAITDASTYSSRFTVDWQKPSIKSSYDFNCFVNKMSGDNPDYIEATNCLGDAYRILENTAQIRYPGLPWFSILDATAVAPIGSIMAKTRTAPLNITTYFAKQGKPAQPEGILFYSHTVPFELIIDTKTDGECYVPTFVSMIPGDAAHHIKKISSSCNTSDDILSAFYIKSLHWRKVFIFDKVTAPFSETMGNILTSGSETSGTLSNVVLDVTDKESLKYFTYNGQVYFADRQITEENPVKLATDEQKANYTTLLKLYGKQNAAENLTPELVHNLNEQARATFAQTMDSTEAEKAVVELLENMPNNTALHIPQIAGTACPADKIICWYELMNHLAKHRQINMHKIIWFDEVRGGYSSFTDVIIEITPKETRLFYKDADKSHPKSVITKAAQEYSEYKDLTEDYIPNYAKLLADFAEHLTLDEALEPSARTIESASVRQHLTSASIAKIKAALERGPIAPGAVATLVNTINQPSVASSGSRNIITATDTPANIQNIPQTVEETPQLSNILPPQENNSSTINMSQDFQSKVVNLIVEALNDAYKTKRYNPLLAERLENTYNKAINRSIQSRSQADADLVTWLSLAEMVLGSKENPIFLEQLYQTTLKPNFSNTNFPAYNMLP